jgi:hypothetical protein
MAISNCRYTPNQIESDEEDDDVNKRVWRPDFPTSPATTYPSKESKSDVLPTLRNPNHPMSKSNNHHYQQEIKNPKL